MGRSIPSFRMLIDIERSEWRTFREKLSNKKDKEYLNKLFSIPKLYCHSLSNLSRPIITEPILLSVLFQSSKDIDKAFCKSNTATNDIKNSNNMIQENVKNRSKYVSSTNCQISNKDYYYAQLLEEWKEFSDCLSMEDESIFIEMVSRCYDSYHLAINSCINDNSIANKKKEKRSCLGGRRTTSLFMALYLYQQKQINYMNSHQRQLDSYI